MKDPHEQLRRHSSVCRCAACRRAWDELAASMLPHAEGARYYAGRAGVDVRRGSS